ncbi:MAG: hypothetical protein QXY55_05915 [Candidatus Korarchaeota archaeon]
MQKLIETKMPLAEINIVSEYEMAFLKLLPTDIRNRYESMLGVGRLKAKNLPKVHNFMYYPARLPLSATRAVTLASLLPHSMELEEFLRAIGFENMKESIIKNKIYLPLSMVNPDNDLVSRLLNDNPINYIVVDPMAGGGSIPVEAKRLGLTVIAGDYNPVSYLLLRATVEFPAKYGAKLYNLVKEEIEKFLEYLERRMGKYYIKKDREYIMVPSIEHSCGAIVTIVKETALHKGEKYAAWYVDNEKRRIKFRISDTVGPSLTICPFCQKPISVENLRKDWIKKHKEVINRLLQGDESVADDIPKYYTILAVHIAGTKYREASPEDERILIESARELARVARESPIAEYLPITEIPESNEVFDSVRKEGLDFWHYLFTPRQLLFLYESIKYIRERSRELKRAYGELGVAVALYLALGLVKTINYNAILTQWHSGKNCIRDIVGSQYALSRKAKLGYDFIDANVLYILPWAFEATEENFEAGIDEEIESTAGGMLPVIKLLCESLGGSWHEGADAIYIWDAREIDKYLPPRSVDLINVDPPYYEQHNYSGIMELFWVIIQTAVREILDDLFPKDRIKLNWSPFNPEIPRDIEMHGKPPEKIVSESKFGEDFKKFLNACAKVIKPDGLLVVWYSYGKLSGWEELFQKYYESGYAVTKVWQVWTQSSQRRVALHTRAFFTSLVIVARPHYKRELILDVNDPRFENEISRRVKDSLTFILARYGIGHLREALVTSIADGFAGITMFELPSVHPLEYKLMYIRMLNKALEISINTVLKELVKYAYPNLPGLSIDTVSRLYLMLLLASYHDVRSHRLLVPHDFANRISQVLRVSLDSVIVKGQRSSEKQVDSLVDPKTMASRGLFVSKALALIYDLIDRIQQGGIRSAEEFAREHSLYAPLALAIATLAWEKVSSADAKIKESVLLVLKKVVR